MPQARRKTTKRDDAQAQTQINTEDIAQLEAGRSLLVQMLQEAHGAEAFAGTTLQAHIAMTPEGQYRSLLERHLVETRDQARRLQERLDELGASRSLVSQAFGVASTAVGTGIALTKGPIDMIRGKAGEEKLVKNAKDEITTEAQEIATYDAVEHTARAIGDTITAELAVSIREEEQRTFDVLREQLPQLVTAMVRSIAAGDASFDPSKTGAAQVAQGVAQEARRQASELRDDAVEEASELRDSAEKTGRAAGRRFERATQGPTKSDLPISNYDSLTATEVNGKLSKLSGEQLRTVEDYERHNRSRRTVLDRIDSLKQNA